MTESHTTSSAAGADPTSRHNRGEPICGEPIGMWGRLGRPWFRRAITVKKLSMQSNNLHPVGVAVTATSVGSKSSDLCGFNYVIRNQQAVESRLCPCKKDSVGDDKERRVAR
jgi:hypothetical protein